MNQLQMLKRALIAYVTAQGDKNLFDKNNPNIINGYIDGSTLYITPQSIAKLVWIEIEPNSTYTVTKLPQSGICGLAIEEPRIYSRVDVRYNVATDLGGTSAKYTVTTGANHKYLIVSLLATSGGTYTAQEMIDSLVIMKV